MRQSRPHPHKRLTLRPGADGARPRGGFTLIELLVVISVIAILAGMLLVAVRTGGVAAKKKATESTLAEVGMAIGFYTEARGTMPPETYPGLASSECLAFCLGVQDKSIQLKKTATADLDSDGAPELVDAWGQPLLYNRWHFADDPTAVFVGGGSHANYSPVHNPKGYDLFSVGPKGSDVNLLKPTAARVGNLSYDIAATDNTSAHDAYQHDNVRVGKQVNKYIGNW